MIKQPNFTAEVEKARDILLDAIADHIGKTAKKKVTFVDPKAAAKLVDGYIAPCFHRIYHELTDWKA